MVCRFGQNSSYRNKVIISEFSSDPARYQATKCPLQFLDKLAHRYCIFLPQFDSLCLIFHPTGGFKGPGKSLSKIAYLAIRHLPDQAQE